MKCTWPSLLVWLAVGCQTAPPDRIPRRLVIIDGAVALTPMLVAAAHQLAADRAAYDVEVHESSSGDGIKRFIAGDIDIAATGRGPKDAEYESSVEKNRDLYLTNVAFDGVVVIVHPGNPVEDLTEAQLRAVFFDGSTTDWAQLSGGKKTGGIHVYAAPATQSGVTDYLAHHLTGKGDSPLVAGARGVKTDLDLIDAVAGDPDGISIASLGRASSAAGRVKVATINGIQASERTVLRAEYPLWRRAYVITNGRPQGADRDFVAYLMSPPGQRIARQVGLVPVALEDVL